MDLKNISFDMIMHSLKNKKVLTGLEEDVLSSLYVLNKVPYIRVDVEKKITENSVKYTDIWSEVLQQSSGNLVPLQQLSDEDLQDNLRTQIQKMWIENIEQNELHMPM